MSERYILNGHEPVPEDDLLTWARWMETGDRHVGITFLDGIDGQIRVSTVFLGLDHRFGGIGGLGSPILFETMIFGGTLDGDGDRYGTWDEAAAGHERWIDKARAALETERTALRTTR